MTLAWDLLSGLRLAARRRTRPGCRHRMTLVLVAALLAALWASWGWVDAVRMRWALAELRAAVATTATPYAGSLGSALNKRLALVRGLAAFVTVEVRKDAGRDGLSDELEEEFAAYADALRASVPGIRNISAAPGFVVRLVNPVAGNERVLGNNLLADPRPGFPETVRRAVGTRDVATHGPVELIQGGPGLIARAVVFRDGEPWGAVGAVFDLGPILEEANLSGLGPQIVFALRRAGGHPFAGREPVLGMDPIIERIRVPDGDWELALAPAEGWEAAARARAAHGPVLALFVGGGGLLILVVVLVVEGRGALARLVEQRTRELEQARRDADHKAEELALARRELEQFAFAAAHDLQEPVRTMGSYAQLLQREIGPVLDEERAVLLDRVVEGAKRLKALLRDVQIFIAETAIPLPDGPVAADRALDAALLALGPQVARAGGRITRDPLPAVLADERRLREIFLALIANALEYRHPDRKPDIHVRACRIGDEVVIEVRDNGIGIDPRYHEQIFQVFRRLHGRDEHPGTGMGLPIARKMAERLGGGLAVRSEAGQGSSFLIRLPAAAGFRTVTPEDAP